MPLTLLNESSQRAEPTNSTSESNGQPSHLPANGVGAVVIGGDFQGLGIARSLGRQGVPVCIIDDEHCIGRYSRYATHAVRVRDLKDQERTVETLLDVGRRLNLKGWVLYPTRDETVAALSRHRRVLSEWFRVPTPAWSVIRSAWDKRETYRLADELNIPTPKTWLPRNVRDLDEIGDRMPLVIKPAIKEHFIYATKVKAWRADTREELVARFRQAETLLPPGEIMIQDLVPGGSQQLFGYCAFFKERRAVATMVTRYGRQHPPQFGRSCTFVETVELPILEELAQRFLRRMDYYGLVEIEFKLDPRDGEYKLLDVNARTWGYHKLGAAAGVDFPHILFADQLGENVEPARARPGMSWIRLLTDLPAGIVNVMRGRLKFLPFVKSVLHSDTEAVFTLDDPLPGIAETALIPYLIHNRGF
jgi:D-aspartate ligase